MTTQQTNRALNWEDEVSKEGEDRIYTILPVAEYPFMVKAFKRAEYNGGDKIPACHQAVVTLEIDAGELGKVEIIENFYLTEETEWRICSFFTCIGFRKSGDKKPMRWPDTPGNTGMCKTKIDTWKSKKTGKEHQATKIDRFLEPAQLSPEPEASGLAPTSF